MSVSSSTTWTAPFPPYDPTDTASFSYETVLKRWPVIITNLIDRIYRTNHDLLSSEPASAAKAADPSADAEDGDEDEDDDEDDGDDEVLSEEEIKAKVEEGKGIIATASKLKYEMARDRPLEHIPDDGQSLAKEYNAALDALVADGRGTWFTAPWLFAECYLYRLFRSWFAQTKYWSTFDPFWDQKVDSFRSSGTAVHKLADTMHDLELELDVLAKDEEKTAVLFAEMLQVCLWGNATDLSLLTNLTHDEIQALQLRTSDPARDTFILRDDTARAWDAIKSVKDGRVDIVLDNSGFELFTDLVFADFLIRFTGGRVRKVVFHPKNMPWFVSDVTPRDFAWTLDILASEAAKPGSFFSGSSDGATGAHLGALVARWKSYVDSGAFELCTHSFWIGHLPYFYMPNELKGYIGEAALVVFKGDLNYRKLTGDVRWPVTTPFEEAIGPLKGAFPVLSLRTNKADVVVGISEEDAKRAEAEDPRWRVSGRYAVVSFAGKQI